MLDIEVEKERARKRSRDHYHNDPVYRERAKARSRAQSKTRSRIPNDPREAERHLKRKYGITWHEYNVLLQQQGGVCAISGEVNPDGSRLVVDHCHVSGLVRGLLTANYNRMIGIAKDRPELLRAAADYLERTASS
jgi:hypothetical protein